MYLFYAPDIDTEPVLSATESAHAVRVLRLREGDPLLLTDGRGNTYEALVTLPHPKACQFEITKKIVQHPRHYKTHIAIAPTKNIERMEWAVEKCTEIGVDSITPLLCRYSERKELKIDRLQNIIVAACKQSLKASFPTLNAMTRYEDFLAQTTESQRFIAHCYETDKQQLVNLARPLTETVVMIGPEGDFSQQEVQQALEHGFLPVALGNERLRTETAAIAACHTIALVNLINNEKI